MGRGTKHRKVPPDTSPKPGAQDPGLPAAKREGVAEGKAGACGAQRDSEAGLLGAPAGSALPFTAALADPGLADRAEQGGGREGDRDKGKERRRETGTKRQRIRDRERHGYPSVCVPTRRWFYPWVLQTRSVGTL